MSVIRNFNCFTKITVFATAFLASQTGLSVSSGQKQYEELLKRTPLFNDPQLTTYIEDLGAEVVSVSEMAGEKFIFSLLDDPALNAFATADNFVYINRGLLNYVSNEAQLVSVIAHEVAHVTRGHINKQSKSGTATQVLSTVAAILANSNEVYEAGMAYGNSKVRSMGRNHELEADQSGAEYMAKLGYDVDQMISMLSIMKDFETLQKDQAKRRGAIRPTYHGVFASHPRNDARLRAVVSRAKKLTIDRTRGNGAEKYRALTQNLIWGENFLAKDIPKERFSDLTWRVRFDYPEGWVHTRGTAPKATVGHGPDRLSTLSMSRLARTAQTPEEYLYNQLNISEIKNGEEIAPSRLKGFTGLVSSYDETKKEQSITRVAVIYYKLSAYVFEGKTDDGTDFVEQDKLFLQAINTFRPISQAEIAGQKPQRIHYVQATANTTFDGLAKAFSLSKNDVDTLRVINGLYPTGEPQAGEIVKVFRQ